ncbi:hypothetical protein [Ancylobacter rudongensis]|uniref:Uncharacterized protein n=1 Tax=Ancylobacter rudongensis TaxID=177413 RepID=A0A1G4TF82_9HYPH|nr:hypothetical protein [Ancylobacter rudongensis]SCW79887.1 hypothetical protein SAMN05660859_2897 [Ancylobacter rudongensis]
MTALLGLLASPLGRGAALLLAALALAGGIYLKGRSEGRAACIAQGERDVLDTIERANGARADADRRNADERRLRDDDTFRRDEGRLRRLPADPLGE